VSRPVSAVDIEFLGAAPTPLEREYMNSAVAYVTDIVPDLHRHVGKITVRPERDFPPKARSVMNDDEMFMLRFVNAKAVYLWPYDPIGVGEIFIDRQPYVDFLVGILLHELAHAIDRSRDPERLKRAFESKTRMEKHHRLWSDIALPLYQVFGCEKAALFNDGMAYRSTRNRHAQMVPTESEWLWKVWTSFDRQEFGELRHEFDELFGH
jgi:hypothetical protein